MQHARNEDITQDTVRPDAFSGGRIDRKILLIRQAVYLFSTQHMVLIIVRQAGLDNALLGMHESGRYAPTYVMTARATYPRWAMYELRVVGEGVTAHVGVPGT